MSDAHFDVTQLRVLEATLAGIPARAMVTARKIVEVGAVKVKKGAQQNVASSRYRKHMAGAVSYDLEVSPMEVAAEVGFDKDKTQGPLGNLIEYGSRNNPPQRPLGRALDAEAEPFARHAADLGDVIL